MGSFILSKIHKRWWFYCILFPDNASDTESSDEPPPLPEKTAFSDYSNLPEGQSPVSARNAANRKSKVGFLRIFARSSTSGISEHE